MSDRIGTNHKLSAWCADNKRATTQGRPYGIILKAVKNHKKPRRVRGFLFLYEGRNAKHFVSEAPNVTKRNACFAFESSPCERQKSRCKGDLCSGFLPDIRLLSYYLFCISEITSKIASAMYLSCSSVRS